MLAAADDRRLVWSLVVSELFRKAVGQDFLFGNAVAELVHELGSDYAPDIDGLLGAYRPLASVEQTGGVGAQIAWAAGGSGLTQLLSGLAPALSSPADRLAAARLLAHAAAYISAAGPPIFGGAPPAPELPPVELIDDLTTAAGGIQSAHAGPTRGLPPGSRSEPDPAGARPEPRWINAVITDAGRPEHPLERAFRAGAVHEIAVFIGPEQEGALAAKGDESFDEALGPVGDMEQLLVMLIPPPAISPPQTGTIFLPQTGASRPCTFGVQLPVDLDLFEAQIQVYHRNRMIQLALLRGAVVADPDEAGPDARIELELAVIRPGTADLGNREQFDLAVARTGAHTTGVADEELVLFDNDRIEGVVPTLTEILESIATGEPARRGDLEDPDVVEHLRALAFQGRELDEAIGEPLRDQLGDRTLDRVQVLVESASDFLPIELVYGFPTPSTDAGLCPGWKDALLTGRCEADHEAKGPRHLADTVCPLGFWALSKVIERQVVGAESWARQGLRGVEFAVRSHPSAERMSLQPPSVALFAASNRVDEGKKGQIERRAEDARAHRGHGDLRGDVGRLGRGRRSEQPDLARAALSHEGAAEQRRARDRRGRGLPARPAEQALHQRIERRSSCRPPARLRDRGHGLWAADVCLEVSESWRGPRRRHDRLGARPAGGARRAHDRDGARICVEEAAPGRGRGAPPGDSPQAACEGRADRALPHGLRRRRLAGRRRLARRCPLGGRLPAPHDHAGRQDEHATRQAGQAAHPELSLIGRRDDRHSEISQPQGRARDAECDQQPGREQPPTRGEEDEDAERKQRDHDSVDRQPTLFQARPSCRSLR